MVVMMFGNPDTAGAAAQCYRSGAVGATTCTGGSSTTSTELSSDDVRMSNMSCRDKRRRTMSDLQATGTAQISARSDAHIF